MYTTMTALIATRQRADLYTWAEHERQARLARQARSERGAPEPTGTRRPRRLRVLRAAGLH